MSQSKLKISHENVFTVGIGGAAGDGVREAGATLGAILAELGYESFLSFTYPSLIRGGHNFARISFSKEKVYSDHVALDVLIALNEESVTFHKDEMAKGSVVLADSFAEADAQRAGCDHVVVPMAVTAKAFGALAITRNSMALGALCYLLDLDYNLMQTVLTKVFKDKMLDMNLKLADKGYDQLKADSHKHTKHIHPSPGKKELIDGNTALARGFMAAGLDFYIGYPMTPATSILHYLAGQQKNSSVRVIQPESELSVINMALGMSYAGKRVAVGSATGGFALMQEAFSCAGIAELPLVVAVSQRQGPATGLPTFSSQTDLRFAIHAGHGEFPRLVVAPGDSEEAFALGAQALNLAWKFQVPVIVLLDKILSEHASTALLDPKKITVERGLMSSHVSGSSDASAAGKLSVASRYGRYEITKDGISPMAFPGTPHTVVKVTSYEHDQSGITTEESEKTEAMLMKRFAKSETMKKSLHEQETVKIYGDPKSKDVLVFWGSTKGPVLESLKYVKKPVKCVQILWLEPFDAKKVAQELEGARKIINIECNHDAQMANLIKEKTGIDVTDLILKFDSRPFEPIALAEQITKLLS